MNITILKGRLTNNPELKTTQSGTSVCSFTLAVDKRYTQENGPTADFINCVAWKKTAEFINKYFTKGQEMLIEGSLQVRSYTDNSGAKRYVTEVIVDNVEFCGPKQQAELTDQETPSQPVNADIEVDDNDDLPF